MSANKKENLIVGLDIGTTKICAIVGNVTEDGIDIVGIGTSPSSGLRKGVVINIESTVASIRKAINEAELMAGCEIKSVYAGIAGGHIKGINSQGVIAIKNREVAQEDVRRVRGRRLGQRRVVADHPSQVHRKRAGGGDRFGDSDNEYGSARTGREA